MAETTYDFVIAGGGSAASVAAMRLVRDFGFSVLILERGPRRTNRLMAMPAGYMKYLGRDDFLEMHRTVPQPRLGGRGPIVPVARVLGGGSAVNAMVYMRGQKEDYDGWAAHLGDPEPAQEKWDRFSGSSGRQTRNPSDWTYDDVLPHFTGVEQNARFNDAYHGIGGTLRVSEPGTFPARPRIFCAPRRGWGTPTIPISTASARMASASCSTRTASGGATRSALTPFAPSTRRPRRPGGCGSRPARGSIAC
jgi:choline dehydrogenase-like flavoprotein